MRPGVIVNKNEVCTNGTSEQKHEGKDHLLIIVISGNIYVENFDISPHVNYNASPNQNDKTTVVFIFLMLAV